MTNFLQIFVRDEAGAAAAEYALILAVVGAGIAGAAYYLGQTVSTSLHDTGAKIASCGGTAASSGTGC